jgi:hypothetical protein
VVGQFVGLGSCGTLIEHCIDLREATGASQAENNFLVQCFQYLFYSLHLSLEKESGSNTLYSRFKTKDDGRPPRAGSVSSVGFKTR